jgi:hypothetical protein
MAFTVISNSFKDGDYLPNDFILSADFGFGCTDGNKVAASSVVRRSSRHHPYRYLFTIFTVKVDKLNVTADSER